MPVHFDALTNEYSVRWPGAHGESSFVLRYCPICGGAAPTSQRDSLFTRVTSAEVARLSELLTPIETIDDALRILGPPDWDMAAGNRVGSPYAADKAQVVEEFRTLRYEHLSETVVVDIADRPGRRVGITYVGKYIGPPGPADGQA